MTVLAGVPPDLEYLNKVDQVILQQINLVESQYWLHFRFQRLKTYCGARYGVLTLHVVDNENPDHMLATSMVQQDQDLHETTDEWVTPAPDTDSQTEQLAIAGSSVQYLFCDCKTKNKNASTLKIVSLSNILKNTLSTPSVVLNL